MKQRQKIFGSGFFLITILGTLFLLVELIFQSFGRSICHTEGCRVISRHARFGDISIILIGLSTFVFLALLSFLTLYRNRVELERYINLILVVSLAAEGFFAGYQAFSIHAPCLICLITLGFFLTLGMLRFFYGEKDILAGFLSFAGVFALFYMILPAESAVNVPQGELILFYSKGCKYCAEISKEMEAHNIRVNEVPVAEYTDFLKKMEIEYVPTLYVNKQTRKIFLTGKQAIDQYLFNKSRHLLSKIKYPPSKKTRLGTETQNKTKPESEAQLNTPDQLLNTPTQSANTPNPLIDPGMCIEDKKCE